MKSTVNSVFKNSQVFTGDETYNLSSGESKSLMVDPIEIVSSPPQRSWRAGGDEFALFFEAIVYARYCGVSPRCVFGRMPTQ